MVATAEDPNDSPLGYFCRSCACADDLVEDLPEGAAVPARAHAIDAHVEELAIVGVGVARVGHGHVVGHGRALEGGVTCGGKGQC